MLESLPYLKKQLQKIHSSPNIDEQSKIQKYQRKMLQLLIREKTTILENEQLVDQLGQKTIALKETQQSLKGLGLGMAEKQHENLGLKNKVQRLTQALENLDVQNKMNQMGRMNEEQKNAELLEQCQLLQQANRNLQAELTKAHQEIIIIKTEMQQNLQQHELDMKKCEQRFGEMISERDQANKKLQQAIQQAETQLQSCYDQIQKLEFKTAQLSASETALKQKCNQHESLLSGHSSKINQLTKDLHLAKLQNNQFQENIYSNQILQGEQSFEFSKLDKENKKIKKELSTLTDKITELEDEKTLLQQKNQQLAKNSKNTKKQLEKLKDSLTEATENQTGTKSRIDKFQQSIRMHKQSLQQKQQQVLSLKQQLTLLQKQSQQYKSEAITSKFNLEETKKKYEIVVEARSIAQEKLVLEREENAKSLSSMIKEKDLSYRQNYKLLQLLEVKDKTLEKIMNGLKNVDELEKELALEISAKENVTKRLIDQIVSKDIGSHKDRVRVIDEHLQKFKL